MNKFEIIGGIPLSGEIKLSGSKNATLPILIASILSDQDVYLSNIPNISDVTYLTNILMNLGVKITLEHKIVKDEKGSYSDKVFKFNAKDIKNLKIDYELVKQLRASIVLLGPCLSKFGSFEISLPGGCPIGARPINYHLDALKKMGASINIEDNIVKAKGRLSGAKIVLEKPSLGATQNILMASIYAKGTTRIENASIDPEMIFLCNFLKQMGAKIYGIGTNVLEIEEGSILKELSYKIPSDRIEAATYCCIAGMTNGRIILKNAKDTLLGIREYIEPIGIGFNDIDTDTVEVFKKHTLKSKNITTDFYPGFITDFQAQVMALLCLADGESTIKETIFENRFMHVPELNKMGADISIISKNEALIRPIKEFKAIDVKATDLRASACLLAAALSAKGRTIIENIDYIERGYEDIVLKLRKCGAQINKII